MSSDNGFNDYRKNQDILYNFSKKYSKLIELDLYKRSASRLVNFVKKYMLFNPLNISPEDIAEIPGIYRFRCYMYGGNEIDLINEMFNTRTHLLNEETDYEMREILNESLIIERDKQFKNAIKNNYIHGMPIMLDLRYGKSYINNYGIAEILFDDQYYYLEKSVTNRMINQSDKVNLSSIRGERFGQMINHSKALAITYAKNK